MAHAKLSALISVKGDHADLVPTFEGYRAALRGLGRPHEMVWIFDGRMTGLEGELRRLAGGDPSIRLVRLSRWAGEAAAIASGLAHSDGGLVLTLPGHGQIDPDGIHKALATFDEGPDVVVGRRLFGTIPPGQRLQSRLFHGLVEQMFGTSLHDLGCRLRLCRRDVLEEIGTYGTQWRFLPLIAAHRGFQVWEVAVRPGTNGNYARPGILATTQRLLDLLSLFLLLKFTKRPLRFFGPIGLAVLVLGLLVTSLVSGQKLFFGEPLADRPALVLGVLQIVLGLQVIAVGLIGEIIIFAQGREIRDIAVDRIVEADPSRGQSAPVQAGAI